VLKYSCTTQISWLWCWGILLRLTLYADCIVSWAICSRNFILWITMHLSKLHRQNLHYYQKYWKCEKQQIANCYTNCACNDRYKPAHSAAYTKYDLQQNLKKGAEGSGQQSPPEAKAILNSVSESKRVQICQCRGRVAPQQCPPPPLNTSLFCSRK